MTTTSCQITLYGYDSIEEIYRDGKTIVCRAVPTLDNNKFGADIRSVVIKMPATATLTYQELLNFRHQYTILKNLDVPGVVRAYALEESERGYLLVMEDVGSVSLADYCREHRLTLLEILGIAIQIADALDALARHQIVYKDLNPANLSIHPVTKHIQLIDFSIASLLPRETPQIVTLTCLEGNLAYLSPEQTGRMNRSVDYRSDFYSFGVTLYQLLTGRLPFESQDPLELIHCHLAQTAPAVDRVNPEIPTMVGRIVSKLMSKNAEDRYQSAVGIEHDLKLCLTKFQTINEIPEFELGTHDFIDRFIISEKLYGREREIEILLKSFDRAAAGSTELIAVTGYSGIGKTAVIDEIHKPIARQQGYFIKGKFDQFNRNIPFSAFVRAFRDLMAQLLVASDRELDLWREQILAAVGDNGQLAIEVIPELERIIGTQPAVTPLDGIAAQNRFNSVFERFIRVFATPAHPLVIFLDDLQWADTASLSLLQLLITENPGYLLAIVAYRDNEVSPTHPALVTLEAIATAGAKSATIALAPLKLKHINSLVADTLHTHPALALPLATLIDRQTQGNPFFATQLLKTLASDGQIEFDRDNHCWQCDLARVNASTLTADVLELMDWQLQKLPPATQEILKLASCIGDRFDLETLAIVSERSVMEAAMDLWPALEAGSILPQNEIYKFYVGTDRLDCALAPVPAVNPSYQFLHDRVQQAAYVAIPDSERAIAHYQIGKLLLQNTEPTDRDALIFTIVNQLNFGMATIETIEERDRLATLNFLACRKATAATATRAAWAYASMSIELLADDPSAWQRQYALCVDLYILAAEIAAGCGEFVRMRQLIAIGLDRVQTFLERVEFYLVEIQASILQNRLPEAISTARFVLAQFGIEFPDLPTAAQIEQTFQEIASLIGSNRQIVTLFDLPEMTEPEKIAIVKILSSITQSCHITGSPIYPLVVALQVKLSIACGRAPASPFSYAAYGILLLRAGEVEMATQFGRLAYRLIVETDCKESLPETLTAIGLFLHHRQHPLRETLPMLEMGYGAAIAAGKIEQAGYCGYGYCINAYWSGSALAELELSARMYRQHLQESQQIANANYCEIVWESTVALLGNSDRLSLALTEPELAAAPIAEATTTQNWLRLFMFYLHRTVYRFVLGDVAGAKCDLDCAREYSNSAAVTVTKAGFYFYDSLVTLALASETATDLERSQELIAENQSQLAEWASYAPTNYTHKWQLVEAEWQRAFGTKAEAIDLYDLAITGAKTNGYIQEEALANELAAKFYLEWDKPQIAAVYMQAAYQCYGFWGATAKVEDLERRYPHLLASISSQSATTEFSPLSTLTTIGNSASSSNNTNLAVDKLDLVSVLRSAQALTSTIELSELITQLHQIILQTSGAQTCILALPARVASALPNREEAWQIHSLTTAGAAAISTRPLADSADYPATIIDWVKNHQQTLIGDGRQSLEIVDRYLLKHQPQSIFALPIVKQEIVLGVLYLEHRDIPHLFTQERQIVISFLASQAAIAIDNANRYQDLLLTAEQLRLQQSYLEALLNNIPHIAWLKDRDSRFIAVNQPFAQACNWERQDLIGCNDFDIWPQELAQKYRDDDRQVMQSGASTTVEERIAKIDGSYGWLETIKTPIRDPDGEIAGTVGIALDITHRKQAEIALRESEARYQKLADNLPGVIYQLRMEADGSLSYPYISSGCWELFQLDPALVMTDIKCLFQMIHPEDSQASYLAIAESAQNLTPKSIEGRFILNSGKTKWIKSISRPERQADGAIVWDGMMFDITEHQAALRERERAERELLESKQFLQTVIDNLPLYVYWKDRNSVYLGCNDKFSSLGGLPSSSAIIGKTDRDLAWHDLELLDTYIAEDVAVMETQTAKLGKIQTHVHPDGSPAWIELNKVPLLDATGEVVGVLGTFQDVTPRQQAQLDLIASRQQHYNLIQSLNGVVWEYDLVADRFSFVSDRAITLFGYSLDDWRQPLFWERHLHPDDLATALKIHDEAIATRANCQLEYRLLTHDGRTLWVYDICTFEYDFQGRAIASSGVLIDISDRKQAETQLQESNERLAATNVALQRATQLKDEFLATMSHELRTPLNAILGMSEALQERVFGDLNQEQLKSIDTIARGGKHLLSLITDILDVSKITAGKLELNITKVSLSHLCNSSLAFVRQQALQKQIQLDLQLPPITPKIDVDDRRMRQVLINLLGNAVKFTPKGGRVALAVAVRDLNSGTEVEFSVTDTGIGIAQQDLDRLFEPFVQLDSKLNRLYEGTGLGLTLVKQIVELHGGNVSVTSKPDLGSCFIVRLPCQCVVSESGDLSGALDLSTGYLRPVNAPLSSLPLILLVEDRPANVNTISSYLNAKGYQTLVAGNGLEAIRILQECIAANKLPDVILMDIQMPEMDGIEAIDRIRRQLYLDDIPIIALTALAMAGDRERCLAVGATEYLTKPVQLKQLNQMIQQLVRRASG